MKISFDKLELVELLELVRVLESVFIIDFFVVIWSLFNWWKGDVLKSVELWIIFLVGNSFGSCWFSFI